ncbi:hypothetical protein TNCV_1213711 [Trichonephila clavipes]|nr:hypothetical protein TNCV_1213711 [Trichonephila clavipes]
MVPVIETRSMRACPRVTHRSPASKLEICGDLEKVAVALQTTDGKIFERMFINAQTENIKTRLTKGLLKV